MIGANVANGKWIRGKLEKDVKQMTNQLGDAETDGTKFVWNSLRSTLREPSKRSDAVTEDTTWAIRRLRFVSEGWATFRRFLQMS